MHAVVTSQSPKSKAQSPLRAVLIIEDEPSIREVLVDLFSVADVEVSSAGALDAGLALLRGRSFDLVITDIRLGGNRDGGLQVMAAAGLLCPDAGVVALTAYPDDDNRHASARLGAAHFIEKPAPLERIAEVAALYGVPTAITMRVRGAPA
ncbi:MAG: hypothetical protein JWO05_1718 [Gemmatimonadetes bacterium]|nr:hypothetical protein [Gemmatimonadota bacterium]